MKAGFLGFGLALALGTAGQAEEAEGPWPDGAKAAVVLTYDDALTSQLDNAVPALDAAGFNGTFFLSNIKQADVARWRAAAESGHELGNHTIFHACPAAVWATDPRNTAEDYTIPSILSEIEQQNVMLHAIDGKQRHGMATPCGASLAGGQDYIDELRAADSVDYVRAAGASGNEVRDGLDGVDLMNIPARGFPDDVTGEQLIAYAEEARQGGGIAVFLFHGVAGDYLQVSGAAHRELIAWLAAHRSELWVTTLAEAVQRAAAR